MGNDDRRWPFGCSPKATKRWRERFPGWGNVSELGTPAFPIFTVTLSLQSDPFNISTVNISP